MVVLNRKRREREGGRERGKEREREGGRGRERDNVAPWATSTVHSAGTVHTGQGRNRSDNPV